MAGEVQHYDPTPHFSLPNPNSFFLQVNAKDTVYGQQQHLLPEHYQLTEAVFSSVAWTHMACESSK